jgi:sugar/nucleoside kinase (ribokinase family)
VEIIDEVELLGGEAANTANALEHWKAEVLLVGNDIGESAEGKQVKELLASSGIAHLESPDEPTGVRAPVCDIYVTPDGERTMFGRGFSQMEPSIREQDLPYKENAWFTAEPNMSQISRTCVKLAHDAGMNIYLMDFIREGDPIFPGSFWQCSTDWVGRRNDLEGNIKWVKNFVAQNGSFAILSDGPNGFIAGSPKHPVREYPPFPAPAMVDSTGAGDMFRAGMLFGLSQNWPIEDCLRFAASAGSLKCRSLGATSDVPSVEEILAHISFHKAVSERYDQGPI